VFFLYVKLVRHGAAGREKPGMIDLRSVAFRVTIYRKKLGHDIMATKMTAQKASTTPFE
jgi:hypothetical protein